MARKPSEKSKEKQKRGIIGENYQPWVQAHEFSSNVGTANDFNDWKTGRQISLLSMGELYTYAILRYDDNVKNIYEQLLKYLEG